MKRFFAIVVWLCILPARQPLAALAWFLGGMFTLSALMTSVYAPESFLGSAVRLIEKGGPVTGIFTLLVLSGIVLGPWCLLAYWLMKQSD